MRSSDNVEAFLIAYFADCFFFIYKLEGYIYCTLCSKDHFWNKMCFLNLSFPLCVNGLLIDCNARCLKVFWIMNVSHDSLENCVFSACELSLVCFLYRISTEERRAHVVIYSFLQVRVPSASHTHSQASKHCPLVVIQRSAVLSETLDMKKHGFMNRSTCCTLSVKTSPIYQKHFFFSLSVSDHQKLEREARICRLLKHPNIGNRLSFSRDILPEICIT